MPGARLQEYYKKSFVIPAMAQNPYFGSVPFLCFPIKGGGGPANCVIILRGSRRPVRVPFVSAAGR